MDEVTDWLRSMKLEKYAAAFERQEYDGMNVIETLTESQIEEMIKAVGFTEEEGKKVTKDLAAMTRGHGGINPYDHVNQDSYLEPDLSDDDDVLDEDDKRLIDKLKEQYTAEEISKRVKKKKM